MISQNFSTSYPNHIYLLGISKLHHLLGVQTPVPQEEVCEKRSVILNNVLSTYMCHSNGSWSKLLVPRFVYEVICSVGKWSCTHENNCSRHKYDNHPKNKVNHPESSVLKTYSIRQQNLPWWGTIHPQVGCQ